MNTPTYKEQFDKITGAYMRNEIRPLISCACFIGNLLNNNNEWWKGRSLITKSLNKSPLLEIGENAVKEESNGLYSLSEMLYLELIFLNLLDMPNEEESLFQAMSSTLDMLREIHISKGENVNAITLTKRVLDI